MEPSRRSTHSHSHSHSRSNSQSRSKSNNSNSKGYNKPTSSSVPKPSSQRVSDAEYARRLQEEYRREFIQRRATAPVEDAVKQPRSSSSANANVNAYSNSNAYTQSYAPPPPSAPVAPRVPPKAPSPTYQAQVYGDSYTNSYSKSYANTMNDEAYARRLQLEMEEADRLMEEARRSSYSNASRRYEITPVSNFQQPFDEVELECHFPDDDADRRLAQQVQDEELARQLAAQPPTPSNHTRRAPSRTHSSSRHRLHWEEPVPMQHIPSKPLTSSTASDSSSDEMARRIAQEMDDAEMAQRLSLYEQEAMAQQQPRQGARNRGTCYLFLARILPLLCCGSIIAVALLFILGVFDPQNVPFVGDILGGDGSGWVDPFKGAVARTNGNNGTVPIVAQDQAKWSTDGRAGISLEIVNACEDKWTDYLNTAVQKWDNGFPIDPLSLSISRASYDPVCESITGKIKVCNADYGDTRWRGLNELMLNKITNTIVSSTAKMNEFYLLTESDDQKQYTMCHEMGHGFGLPHWDEDFFNTDMGTCMDYTNSPGVNKQPDASNFLFLAQMYGGINITTGQPVAAADVNIGGMQGPRTTGSNSDGDGTSTEDGSMGGRNLRIASTTATTPTLMTRVRFFSEAEQRRPRRILMANERFEVHHVDEINDDMLRLQIYLLAR